MIKILICGGDGFIGGRLSSYLSEFKDKKVFSLSRKKVELKNNNISYLYTKSFDFKSLNNLFKGMDVIVHLACMNSKDCEKNPEQSIIINTNVTKNIVNASINNGVKKLIYMSTIHVYGKNLKGLVSESTKTSPFHPYSISHKKSEDIILGSKTNDLTITIFRLSNTYGFPINSSLNCWNLVINDICKQAIEKRLISLTSNGLQKRNFIQMRDLCRIVKITICANNSLFENQIFNLGGKWTISILELSNFVSKIISKKLEIDNIEIKTNEKNEEFSEFLYDINKIESLNFKTSCEDMEEFNNLIHYCNKNFKYNQ